MIQQPPTSTRTDTLFPYPTLCRSACHPGGANVIAALEEVFGVPDGGFTAARGVLRDFGNMSAVTVLFVLERLRRKGMKGRYLMTALGPGFTAGFQILEA